jgi:hypothetical protein
MKNEYQSYDDMPEPSLGEHCAAWIYFGLFVLLLGLIGGAQ